MAVGIPTKYKSYLYDEEGNTVAVQLDLRNKTIRKFYETMMEDFEDRLDALRTLHEEEATIPLAEVKAELGKKWSKK